MIILYIYILYLHIYHILYNFDHQKGLETLTALRMQILSLKSISKGTSSP